jgi:hypothetical protein
VTVQFTPKQRDAWREMVKCESSGSEESIAQFRRIKAAADQPGFFGDVRRAVLLSGRSVSDLAASIGVDPQQFVLFQSAEAELPAPAVDRLLETLGLRVMQVIPH